MSVTIHSCQVFRRCAWTSLGPHDRPWASGKTSRHGCALGRVRPFEIRFCGNLQTFDHRHFLSIFAFDPCCGGDSTAVQEQLSQHYPLPVSAVAADSYTIHGSSVHNKQLLGSNKSHTEKTYEHIDYSKPTSEVDISQTLDKSHTWGFKWRFLLDLTFWKTHITMENHYL